MKALIAALLIVLGATVPARASFSEDASPLGKGKQTPNIGRI